MKESTLALHGGYNHDCTNSLSVPLHQTMSYKFESTDEAAKLFQMDKIGNIYTRLTNPTTEIFEKKISLLEGGYSAIATASGMAAIFYTIVNVAKQGDNIIVANQVYGGTTTLINHTLKNFGISAFSFDVNNPSKLNSLINKKTKLILFETLSNPTTTIADFNKIIKIADFNGVLTCADNTIATPILIKPLTLGCDLVLHSATKYMTPQGTSLGGVIVERKNLIEKIKNNKRYDMFNEPDESYNNFIYSDSEYPIFTHKLRFTLLRDIGASLSPFNSWLFIQGLSTLTIRIKEQSKSALKIAKFLETHNNVLKVYYSGLKSHENYKLNRKYFKNGSGSILSFEVKSLEIAENIVNKIKLFTNAVSIGNSLSIITHPASTTHKQVSDKELNKFGITPGLIRLSIGLEDPKDLISQLKRVLND